MNNGWPMKTLGELCVINPPKSEARKRLAADAQVSFLPMEDMGINEKFVQATKTKPLSAVQGSYTYFANGDVLLAKITPCFENGKLGIAEGLINGIGFGSSEYLVFRPKTICKEWLYYFLSRESFRVEGAERMSGAVGHKRISKEFIESYPIPAPSTPEQKRIVGILDATLTGAVAAKTKAERNLHDAYALFPSIIAEALSGNARDHGSRALESLLLERRNISYGIVKPGRHDPSGVRLIKSQQVRDNSMDLSADFRITKELDREYARTRLHGGEILLNLVGASIGRSAIAPQELRGANVSRAIAVIPVRHELSSWVQYNLRGSVGQKLIQSKTGGSAQPVLNLSEVKSLTIPFPPLNVQQAIVTKLDALSELTQRLTSIYERKLVALEDLKKSLLHQAFTGKL
jgi:type I restriction enzyme S subunit